jgi:hypothetical protein
MKIHYECSGGFINLQLEYHVDTADLNQELAEELLNLVKSSNVFDIRPGDIAPTSDGPPDVFYYQLSLSAPGKQISLSCNDVTAPVELRPLLARLQELALDQRRKKQ